VCSLDRNQSERTT